MFEYIIGLIETLGYLGVAVLMFIENIWPPIPSEVIMPLAGFLAAQGKMSFIGIVLAGTLGTLASALIWYYVGRKVGRTRLKSFAARHGRWLTMHPEDIDHASDWFHKRGGRAVFFSRLVPGLRTFISIPAGVAGMKLLPFIFYTTLGTGLWIVFLTACGYVLERNYEAVAEWLDPVTYIVLGGFIGAYLWRVYRFDPNAASG